MRFVFGAVVAAVIATAGFAAPASAVSFPAKPGVVSATTQVTFWKDGKKRDARRAHKRQKFAHAHKSHAHRAPKKKH